VPASYNVRGAPFPGQVEFTLRHGRLRHAEPAKTPGNTARALVWPLPVSSRASGRMVQNPFDTIESTHEYLKLLDEVLEEVQNTTDEELQRIVLTDTMVISRGVEAVHLLSYKIEQLRHHVKASSRILNDLRTLRRLLLGERKAAAEHNPPDTMRPGQTEQRRAS
jgi:hypothetical protein